MSGNQGRSGRDVDQVCPLGLRKDVPVRNPDPSAPRAPPIGPTLPAPQGVTLEILAQGAFKRGLFSVSSPGPTRRVGQAQWEEK